jgi:hypothetical protein
MTETTFLQQAVQRAQERKFDAEFLRTVGIVQWDAEEALNTKEDELTCQH